MCKDWLGKKTEEAVIRTGFLKQKYINKQRCSTQKIKIT